MPSGTIAGRLVVCAVLVAAPVTADAAAPQEGAGPWRGGFSAVLHGSAVRFAARPIRGQVETHRDLSALLSHDD